MQRTMRWFALYTAACMVFFFKPLGDLLRLSLSSEAYSHILVIPAIAAALVYAERAAIFRQAGRASPRRGKLVLLLFVPASIAAELIAWFGTALPAERSLELGILAFVILLWAGFACLFGGRVFRAALFPLGFLALMIPPPAALLDRVATLLQWGSADLTSWIFHLTMTPAVRHGLFFDLPGVTIEVAQECSGIRSSIALAITCLAAGYLFLRMGWTRAALMLAVVPVSLIKNGIRIATLSLLAIHIDMGFLFGRLHHDGGFVFFAVGLALLLGVLRGLQRIERPARPPATDPPHNILSHAPQAQL